MFTLPPFQVRSVFILFFLFSVSAFSITIKRDGTLNFAELGNESFYINLPDTVLKALTHEKVSDWDKQRLVTRMLKDPNLPGRLLQVLFHPSVLANQVVGAAIVRGLPKESAEYEDRVLRSREGRMAMAAALASPQAQAVTSFGRDKVVRLAKELLDLVEQPNVSAGEREQIQNKLREGVSRLQPSWPSSAHYEERLRTGFAEDAIPKVGKTVALFELAKRLGLDHLDEAIRDYQQLTEKSFPDPSVEPKLQRYGERLKALSPRACRTYETVGRELALTGK